MVINRKPTGRAASMPAGILLGVVLSVALTVIGVTITAEFINKELITWISSGYAVLAIVLFASWFGAMVAINRVKRQKMAVCLTTGIIYFISLMAITALFFGGQYSGVGETALLICCGSMLAVLGRYNGNRRQRIRKVRISSG